ncbi:MAG TPA: response regulator transcription factor [Solirubrobacteraceae bacterium]|jgi:DNA-binding response OmpR family regulator
MDLCSAGRDPILLVESDRQLANAIAEQLAADGFAVELAHTAEHARVLARQRPPALALLGRLGTAHGAIRLLEEIRTAEGGRGCWSPFLPVVILSSRAGELDVLRAFDCGADDFVDRMAGYLQLRARIVALLRRAASPPSNDRVLDVGGLRIDLAARSVTVRGRPIELRRMEFELLTHLAREPERVFTREELLRAIWGYRTSSSTRTVATHASRLRRKLDERESDRWVISVWGTGYRLI